jgi:hypothetical protein
MKNFIYEPNKLERAFQRRQKIEFPGRGFHTLYTREEYPAEGILTLGYLVGGDNDGLRYSIANESKKSFFLSK